MSTQMAPVAQSGRSLVLEPAVRVFLDGVAAQGAAPIYTLPYAEAREVLEKAQTGVVGLPADTDECELPVGPNDHVGVRIYRPQGAAGLLPAVMYFHGGGWILGSKNTHDRLLRDLVHASGLAFVFVSYTPSPESKFRQMVETCYHATRHMAVHGESFGLDGSRLAVMGDSAGGCLAAVVTQLAKERGEPKLRYQVLLYPVTDAGMDTESYRQFADGPWLTKAAMAWYWDAYAPKVETRGNSMASPLQAATNGLRGLPPSLVIVAENDVLRDEGEAYARKLLQAGVEVTALRAIGTIHDFAMLNALSETQATKSAIRLAAEKLRAAMR